VRDTRTRADRHLAYLEVCGRFACWRRHILEWKIAAVNFLGWIAFGISAIADYVVPSTGGTLDLAAANGFTALGVPASSSARSCSCRSRRV